MHEHFEDIIMFIHTARSTSDGCPRPSRGKHASAPQLIPSDPTLPPNTASPGTVVYVHCAAGVSRSSTAVICYLIGVHGIRCAASPQRPSSISNPSEGIPITTTTDQPPPPPTINPTNPQNRNSFREAIDFVRTRREVAFPNPDFTQQLQRFERDPATQELRSRVRAAFPHDVAMVERDLAEIREALAGLRARLAAGHRPFDPRDRILEAMQAAQERADLEEGDDEGEGEGGGESGKKGRGDDNGGWGLTWVEEERTHHSRTDELPR